MVGPVGGSWHLELVDDPAAHAENHLGPEDLLVLYLNGEIAPAVIDRLLACGGSRVSARNPYWDRWGVTIADPDGYRLVLSQRSWP